MLALKKKREAEAKARAEEEAREKAEEALNSPADAPSGVGSTNASSSEIAAPPKVSLLGVGGIKNASKNGKNGEPAGKKRTPCEIRIQKDMSELDGGIVAELKFPNPNDLMNFNLEVTPDSGYWKGARYLFVFQIPPHYPYSPPKVTCKTPIYHPNINLQGNVCLNILREDWKPVLDINAVVCGLIYLFYEPNPNDPLNHEAADLFRKDANQFKRMVERTLRGGILEGIQFPKLI